MVPDNIADVGDEILDSILECGACKKNFKILKQELSWYRKQKVPIPGECSNCRMVKRAKMRNPRKLWERKCEKCGVGLNSSYAPAVASAEPRHGGEWQEKIYCEKCYLELVY